MHTASLVRSVLAAVVTFTAASCAIEGSPDVTSTRDGWMSFEEFEQWVYQEPDTGIYIVNGDTPISSIEALEEFYYRFADDGTLIVHQSGGQDVKWDDVQKLNITYCVSETFGSHYGDVVTAMADAAGAWEAVADVDFIHDASKDSKCNARTGGVVFDVRPVNSGQYLARAFFPNDSRRNRNVLIDGSSFTVTAPLTLTGILRHELGHTIGFRHEHTRPESGTCFEDSNWRELTSYDSDSVMHYPQCNGTGDWSLVLTAKDAQGAAALYGAPGSTPEPPTEPPAGECLAAGESCSTASDCCSLTCKGRPGDRVCK